MSSSAIYADSFSMYRNPENINTAIQNKIANVADNELLFGGVDYSGSYSSVLDTYKSDLDNIQNGTQGNSSVSGNNSSGSTEIADDGGTKATDEQIAQLRTAYSQIQDEQGWVGKAWNGIKNFFGHSNGSNAVEETLSKAESGEISYEAAVEKLNKYAEKQGSVVDTFANIASGLAVAVGVIAAPFSFGASLALGAGVGAAVKIGIKASDKATNNVEGDYTFTDGLKDGLTGAVGGVVTAATAGIGAVGTAVAKEGGKVLVKETIKQGVISGAKAGAISGGVMGATNYTADAVFDGTDFTAQGLLTSTATGAVGGAVVGGSVGAVTSGISAFRANAAATSADDAANAATGSADDVAGAAAGSADDVAGAAAGSADDAAGAAAGSADDAAGAATKNTFGQMFTNAKDNLVNLFKKGAKIKDLTPGDVRKAFTGKVGSTAQEFKSAYLAMKETNEYKTNLLFRTFIEDLYGIGSTEQV